MSESDFWKNEATLDDIAGVPPVNLKKCLNAIIPELEKGLSGIEYPIIIEIGSGVGRLTIPIAKHFKKGKVTGIDISMKFIEVAREKAKKEKHKPNFVQYTKVFKKCDAVFSMLVFQHLPHIKTYSYIHDVGYQLSKGGVFRFQYVEGKIEHANRHDLEYSTVERWCKEAGLEIVKHDEGLIHPQWTWITAVKK